jgi:hypothetical protein
MLWVIGGLMLLVFLLVVLALINDPTLDPREFGDHLDPELTGSAGVRGVDELVELAARVRKESRGHE